MKYNLRVYDSITGNIVDHEPYDVYKITVNYPDTDRTIEYIGMDRGSCVMQAEVGKLPEDTLTLIQSEEAVTLWRKHDKPT